MNSKRLTAEEALEELNTEFIGYSQVEKDVICALCGTPQSGYEGRKHHPGCSLAVMARLLADRAALEQRVGELRALISEAHEAIAADWAAGGPRKGRCYCIECDGDNDTASPSEPRFIRHKPWCLVSRLAAAKALADGERG